MKRLCFENIEDLVKEVLSTWEKEKNKEEFVSISVVAPYSEAISFLNFLIKNSNLKMSNIKLEDPEINGYTHEWIVTISLDGEVWAQEAYFEDTGYIGTEDSEIIYVYGDVNSKYIRKNENAKLIEFDFFDSYKLNDTPNANKMNTEDLIGIMDGFRRIIYPDNFWNSFF